MIWRGAPIDKLSNELFNLFNLRYLSLRGTLVNELPKSIKKLINLQSLDIRDTQIEVIPREIGNLHNLHHLIAHHFTKKWTDFKFVIGARTPSNIYKLKNLQSVTFIEAKGDLIRRIGSMTQLIRIGISDVKEADEMDLCLSIQNMRLLHFLSIKVTNVEETLRMDALSSPPPNLQKLVLVGKLEKVPQWFCSLQRIRNLHLHWSRLDEDLLPYIATWPHLGRLTLTNACVGNQLCFSTGFVKLTVLNIRNLPQLNEIIIEKGVMPNMKSLEIESCMELKTVPKGTEYLKTLQELFLKSASKELKNCIKEEGSVNFPKVEHIPKIYLK